MFVTAEASEGASITDLRRRPQVTEMLTEDRIILLSVVTALEPVCNALLVRPLASIVVPKPAFDGSTDGNSRSASRPRRGAGRDCKQTQVVRQDSTAG